MEESSAPPNVQLCPSDPPDSAFWSCLNVATPTCLPSPLHSRHNANPSFFSSMTPPPVTPSCRLSFSPIMGSCDWDGGDDGGGDDGCGDDECDVLGLHDGDDGAMPWSKGALNWPLMSRQRFHADESACSPEDMSCATTADGASDGCNACDAFDWANVRSGYIQPFHAASALSPPLPSVAEANPASTVITRSGRKVKPKKLSLSPPMRAMSSAAPPPPLLLPPLHHTISKKEASQRMMPKMGLSLGSGEEAVQPLIASVVLSLERSDSSSSVLPLPGCKCRKNGCLRRYCSCFAQAKACGPDCGCTGCKNDGVYRTPVKAAVAKITSKHPQAFEPKFVSSAETGGVARRAGVGCSCKASNCLKRYCQCFAAGCACDGSCRCTACCNKGGE